MGKPVLSFSHAPQLVSVISAQSASTYANQLISFVVPWLVLSRTQDAASAGLVAFAMGVSAFIGILLGGFVTDRIGGRGASIIADTLSLLTTLLLAITLLFDIFALWLVIVSQVIGVFFDGPGQIAKNTLVPSAARVGNIPIVRAMGLTHTLQNTAMFVGPITAGLLIAVLNEAMTLLVAALIFGACIVLARMFQRHQSPVRPFTVKQAKFDTVEALQFLVREPFLGPMQIFGPFFAFMIPVSVIVFPAWFIFAGESSGSLGIFLGAQALGGIVGGFAFATFGPHVSQYKWLVVSTAAYALALLGISFLQPGSWQAMAVAFAMGMLFTGIMAIPYACFYSRAPQQLLGRLNSIGAAAAAMVGAFATLSFGWLMSATSPRNGILACAVGMSVVALGTIFFPFMKLLDDAPNSNFRGLSHSLNSKESGMNQ